MRTIFVIVYCTVFSGFIYAQGNRNTDSLQVALKTAGSDSLKIALYNDLIYAYAFRDPARAIETGRDLVPLLTISGSSKDWALYYNSIGIAYYFKGDYVNSENSYLNALNMFEKGKDEEQVGRVLNNIGIIFETIKNYEKAKEYYLQSFSIYSKSTNYSTLAAIINNIGMVYKELGNIDSALVYHNQCLALARKYGLKDREADSYLNIGEILVDKKDYTQALDYLQTAYRLDVETNNESGIIETHAALGEAYLGLHRNREAIDHLKTGTRLSIQKDNKELTTRFYKDLADYYLAEKEYRLAYENLLNHKILSDSILNHQTRKQIENLQLLNENERKEREINLLTEINNLKDDQIRSQKNRAALLFIVILFLVVICVLLWIYFRILSRANKMLEIHNKKISEQNEELEKQRKKLIELSTEKDNMIGVVAHDLKSPLSKILGLSTLIRASGNLQRDQLDYLNLTDKVIAEANRLISRMLDINKLESGEVGTNLVNVNLKSVLDDITEVFRKTANEKKIVIHQECREDLECYTDRELIYSLLDNLVSNAIKFSEKEKNIYLNCDKNNGWIKLKVKDEGPGIKKEEIPLLFKKYTRLSARPTAGESSTGLGLAIVDLITEKLNGKIEVNTGLAKGVEFTICLPAT